MEEIYRVQLAYEKKALRPGNRLSLTRRARHGDLDAERKFPYRWPALEPGTIVIFIESFDDLYGTWLKVRAPNGYIYNIKPHMFYAVE